jgi:hypothetical protein
MLGECFPSSAPVRFRLRELLRWCAPRRPTILIRLLWGALIVLSISWFHFPNQVKWPAGVTGGNENIPSPHHRVETTLKEQSISSTFVYLFSIQTVCRLGAKLMCASAQSRSWRFPEVSAVPSYEGKSATGPATGHPKGPTTVCFGRVLTRDNIRSNDRGWSQWGPSAGESMRPKRRRSEDTSDYPYAWFTPDYPYCGLTTWMMPRSLPGCLSQRQLRSRSPPRSLRYGQNEVRSLF